MIAPDAAELIGGRWAVSLPMFLVAVPLLLLSQVMFLSSQDPAGSARVVVAASISGLVAVGLVLLLADRTVLRHRRTTPVPVSLVAGVGTVAGGLRGVVASGVTLVLAGSDVILGEVIGRVAGGAVAGALMVPLGAWAFASIDRLRSQRAELARTLAGTVARTALAQAQASSIRRQTRMLAADGVRDVASGLRELARDASLDDDQLASAIVDATEGRLGPLGRSLWSKDERPPPLAWRTAFVGAVQARQIRILIVVGLLIVVSGPREFGVRPAWEALTVVGATGALVAAGLGVSRLVEASRRRWWHAPLLLLLSCVLLAWVGVALLGMDVIDAAGDAGAVLVFVLAVITLSAIVQAASARAEDRLEHLRASISAAELEELAATRMREEAEREAAIVIHSRVQNALLAAAVTIRQGGTEARGPWLDDLLAALPDLVLDEDASTTGMADVQQAWSGVIDVDVTCDPALPRSVEEDAAAIAQEAIANAFRHGRASRATIDVAMRSDEWVVVVEADGQPPPASVSQGIGLRRVAVHSAEWVLEPGPAGGSRLVAVVRC